MLPEVAADVPPEVPPERPEAPLVEPPVEPEPLVPLMPDPVLPEPMLPEVPEPMLPELVPPEPVLPDMPELLPDVVPDEMPRPVEPEPLLTAPAPVCDPEPLEGPKPEGPLVVPLPVEPLDVPADPELFAWLRFDFLWLLVLPFIDPLVPEPVLPEVALDPLEVPELFELPELPWLVWARATTAKPPMAQATAVLRMKVLPNMKCLLGGRLRCIEFGNGHARGWRSTMGAAHVRRPRDRFMTNPSVVTRKLVLSVEEIWHDNGPRLATPLLKGCVAAVVANPYAGGYVEDITPMMEALKPLGRDMAARLVAALGGPERIQAYGKGALVGLAGEVEHGALWHVPGGYGMRDLLEGSHAIVPSTTKIGPAGTPIDIPIHHRVAAYVRSHFDTLEVRVADAPRPNEMLLVIAMTTGPRPHARVGGLRADEIAKFDGQR